MQIRDVFADTGCERQKTYAYLYVSRAKGQCSIKMHKDFILTKTHSHTLIHAAFQMPQLLSQSGSTCQHVIRLCRVTNNATHSPPADVP